MKLFKNLFIVLFATTLGSCSMTNPATPSQPVDVNGVELNLTEHTIQNGSSFQLEAYVKPDNALNKNVTWSVQRKYSGILSVSETGLVTALAEGTGVVVVTTEENYFTASCTVNVVKKITPATGVSLSKSIASIQQGKSLTLVATVAPTTATTKSVTWSSSNPNVASVAGGVVSGVSQGSAVITATTVDGGFTATCEVTITEPTHVSSVALDHTSLTLKAERTASLVATVSPSDAYDKSITWSSSNPNVATVSSAGVITAKGVGSATITVTTNDGNHKANCTVTVEEKGASDDWTILIYMCGSNLESSMTNDDGYGFAVSDLKEILSVTGQPDDVNIIIETGGCTKWTSNSKAKYSASYNISTSFNQIHRVEKQKIVLEKQLSSKPNMGDPNTLQDFIEYGLNNYPAEKTALILWNHGGGLQGVCFGETSKNNLSNDGLEATEVVKAVSGALDNCGMSGQKLEWIGYDACLMQVQDIAEMNSPYFKYMVGSEESEAGAGWDYDTWIDDLYAGKDTETVLKAIVDGFIKDNGGTSSRNNDQTLSYLKLEYATEYMNAWENMATALKSKITSSNKRSFNDLVDDTKHYADTDYDYYGLFDAMDFVNLLSNDSTFNPGSSYTSAVTTAYSKLLGYASCGKGAGNSNGLCMFWCISGSYRRVNPYTAGVDTHFSNWAYLSNTYYG